MRKVAAFVLVALLMGSSAHAAPFTWTISGIADSGHWDLDNLAGLSYVLRLTTDSAAPDQNFFPSRGLFTQANIGRIHGTKREPPSAMGR